jgi:hypothetical protein
VAEPPLGVAQDKRTIMRDVALTYHRETPSAQAEGAKISYRR